MRVPHQERGILTPDRQTDREREREGERDAEDADVGELEAELEEYCQVQHQKAEGMHYKNRFVNGDTNLFGSRSLAARSSCGS